MSGYRRYFRLRAQSRAESAREVEEEIEAHLAMRIEDLIRAGESPARARALALERFGDRAQVVRSAAVVRRRLEWWERMDTLRRDLVLAWRHARAAPGTSLLTLLTFTLGIGLTTTMFTFVDCVLLRPLPYPAADRLVALAGMTEERSPVDRVSLADWTDWREQNRSLEATSVHMARELTIVSGSTGRHVRGQLVTHDFFDVVRPALVLGRGFTAADAGSGAVVIGAALWRRELGGGALAGAELTVDGRRLPVVGVVRSGSEYPARTEMWSVLLDRTVPRGLARNNIGWSALARLRDDVTPAQAQADLSSIADRIRASDPAADYSWGVAVEELRATLVSEAGEYLRMLFGAVSVVLLIACANIAALTLARGARRRGEVAVQCALGASRARVFRQLLTEQLALALAGGILGVLLTWWATSFLRSRLADLLPRVDEVRVDVRILAFAILLSMLAGVVAGLIPALRTSAADPRAMIGGRGTVRGGRGVPGAPLLIAEIALAVLLLTGGGLLVRSFQVVLERDVGFLADGVAAAGIALTGERYRTSDDAKALFREQLREQLRAHPAVDDVAFANWIPTGYGGTSYLVIDDRGQTPEGAAYRVVSDGYFDVMGMPLLYGRDFDARDRLGSPRVALVSRSLAEESWPGENAVGRRIQTPGMEGYEDVPWLTVIGVVGDVRHGGREEDVSQHVYVLYRQLPIWWTSFNVVVRAADGNTAAAAQAIVSTTRSLDPQLAVEPRDLREELGALVTERRLTTALLSGFAAIALLLAAIGIYGALSFAVAQRAHEIGVRAALGADRRSIMGLVAGDALRVVLVGGVLGMVAAMWLTRLLRNQLVDITNTDPVTYAGAAIVLTAGALIAALVPAYRASRVDPLVALRSP